MPPLPRVTGLFLYPVKALRGFAVPAAAFDELGFVGDRRFLVVDDTGKFLTQRTHPRFALISTELGVGQLTLSSATAGHVQVPLAPDPQAPLRTVSVWKSEGLLAEDCGTEASAWLSDFLGQRSHLVRLGPKFHRPVLKAAARPGDVVTFADACPFLVISRASLDHLNDRIVENHGEPVPMDRFRPNIVIEGCAAFAEDTWPRLQIGAAVFRGAGPSVRCPVTTTDQQTGERGKEPLRTLATFRRQGPNATEVIFGQNLIHETKAGELRVGDEVTPLS